MSIISTYLTFGISISTISYMVGIIGNAILRKSPVHYNKLANLNFVKNEKLNSLIGVGLVKWIVKYTPIKYLNQRLRFSISTDLDRLLKLRYYMIDAEVSHLIGFVFVFIFSVIAWCKYQWILGLTILGINVFMNLNPVLLQQQNKRRINRIIEKFYS